MLACHHKYLTQGTEVHIIHRAQLTDVQEAKGGCMLKLERMRLPSLARVGADESHKEDGIVQSPVSPIHVARVDHKLSTS